MSAKTIVIYALLGVFAPPIGFALMLNDERVPKYVCAACAAWCAVILFFLVFAGSCRQQPVFTGRQL